MGIRYVQTPEQTQELTRILREAESIALDCEAAGFHRYTDQICLVQVTVPASSSANGETFLIDPLAFDPSEILATAVTPPSQEVVMHGADFDIRLLDRDLDIRVRGLFDTQIAASLLGIPAPGLSNLLDRYLGVQVSKKYQRADWAQRPLPEEMLEYAAQDTLHLHRLRDRLGEELEKKGRMEWAREEFRAQEGIRYQEGEPEDPVLRVSKAKALPPRDVALLRAALEWRDAVARKRDRAPFRVAQDQALLRVVEERPASVEELAGLRGFPSAAAREWGSDLLERLQEVDRLPEDRLRPYPKPSAPRRERPDPDEEDRMRSLKEVRNRVAQELEVERGVLLPNHLLREIARRTPRSVDELLETPGIRRWQVGVLGSELLAQV